MISTILVLVLLAVAAWVLWNSRTDSGIDLKKGWMGLVAAVMAIWEWLSGSITHLLS